MSTLKLHAGDFEGRGAPLAAGKLYFKRGAFGVDAVPLTQLEAVEVASEESVKRIAGTAGWGAVGAILLGPVGLLAGLLAGGNRQDVTFVARFKDGRKMLATIDSKAFNQLRAAVF